MDDDAVVISGRTLEDLLKIVREIREAGIKYEWSYNPPSNLGDPRTARFVFADPKYSVWFALKYR